MIWSPKLILYKYEQLTQYRANRYSPYCLLSTHVPEITPCDSEELMPIILRLEENALNQEFRSNFSLR